MQNPSRTSASSSRTWGTSSASRPSGPRASWTAPIAAGTLAGAVVAALGMSVSVTGPWYYRLALPAWAPDGRLLALGWTLCFGLLATAAVISWRAGRAGERHGPAGLFALVGLLILGWCHLFFRYQRPDWALGAAGALAVTVLLLALVAGRRVPGVGLLLLPVLGWAGYIAALTLDVVRLNPAIG